MTRTRTPGSVAAAVALALSLAGCWTMPGQNLHRTAHHPSEGGFGPGTVGGFAEQWSATTDEVPGLGRGVGHPVLAGDGTVLVTSTRSVYALDPATGAQRWAETPGAAYAEVDTDGVVDGDALYVSLRRSGGTGGHWEPAQFDVDSGFWFTGEFDGRQEAVRSGPGFQVLFSRFTAAPGHPGTQTAHLLFGGTLQVQLTTAPDLATRLTLGPDRIFHAGRQAPAPAPNAVQSYRHDGTGRWSTPLDGAAATSPVLADDAATVYVGTDAGTLYALSAADGTIRWSASVGAPVTAPPALAGGTLYVPTASGRLVALAAGGCAAVACPPLWSTPVGGGVAVQPAVAGGVVFTGHDDGTVQAVDAAGCGDPVCAPLWSTDAGSGVTGAPAVGGGRVFVGTADGLVVAYGLP
jgi:outer membrane protein assembly factor BamB